MMPDSGAPTEALICRLRNIEPLVPLGQPPHFPITTIPMDADWKERFDRKYPSVDVLSDAFDKEFGKPRRLEIARNRQALVDGLLKFGGERVCLPAWDGDLDVLLERGRLFSGDGLIERRGKSNGCHLNASLLWKKNSETMLLATGYYISSDGMWRSHTWCLEVIETSVRIVETTSPAIAYFGFAMTEAEAIAFLQQQAGN
jgi:hypothetical protein